MSRFFNKSSTADVKGVREIYPSFAFDSLLQVIGEIYLALLARGATPRNRQDDFTAVTTAITLDMSGLVRAAPNQHP